MDQAIRNQRQQTKLRQRRADRRRILISGLMTFSVMLGLVSAQVATGSDPAIGHGNSGSAAVAHRTAPVQTVASTLTGTGDDGYSEAEYSADGESEGTAETGSSSANGASIGAGSSSTGYSAPVGSSHAS